jgi:hypothetical protein
VYPVRGVACRVTGSRLTVPNTPWRAVEGGEEVGVTYARTLVTMSALVVSSFISKSQPGQKRGNCAGFPYRINIYRQEKTKTILHSETEKHRLNSIYGVKSSKF